MIGILGRKVGMTQLFSEEGVVHPVTMVKAGPCWVTRVRSAARDGYGAIQLGFEPVRKATRARIGNLKRIGLGPLRELRELRTPDPSAYQPGQELRVDGFKPGDRVDVTGITRGRGFAGGMRRWGWHGGPKSHGSMSHRRIGSAGATTFPGRLWKGKHLPGHYGCERVTVRNLTVERVDESQDLLYLRGAVPGPRGGLLIIRAR
jgi:large subunit ribosomal protein L3